MTKWYRRCPCRRTPWFYKPSWYWYGWQTLLPITLGNDEYHRRDIVFGWTVTGRMIIPLWHFNEEKCDPEFPCGPICPKCGMLEWNGISNGEPIQHDCEATL